MINANPELAQQRAATARQGQCLGLEQAGILDACLPEAV